MTTTFNKIHRLKRLWTWEVFVAQYDQGPDIKTLKANYKHPHHQPNKNTVEVISALHEREFPHPFPAEVEGLLDLYDYLSQHNGDLSQDQNILRLERFVDFELARSSTDDARSARLWWLLGDIRFDHCLRQRKRNQFQAMQTAKRAAITAYEQALAILERTGLAELVIRYKLRQNILACYLNTSKQRGVWTGDADTLHYLQASDFMEKTKQLLEDEPFQWIIARNGLRFASLLQQEADAKYFFKALLRASPLFADPDYVPNQAPSLRSSKDFAWCFDKLLSAGQIAQLLRDLRNEAKRQ